MSYRMWGMLGRSEVKQWEQRTASKWDTAIAGRQLLDEALLRQLQAETANALGKVCAAALWDWQTFFDKVPPALVAESALLHDYPAREALGALQLHMAPRCFTSRGSFLPAFFSEMQHSCWVHLVGAFHAGVSEEQPLRT